MWGHHHEGWVVAMDCTSIPPLHAPACQQAWEWAWTHQDASPACDNPNSARGTSPMEILFPRHQSGLVAAV